MDVCKDLAARILQIIGSLALPLGPELFDYLMDLLFAPSHLPFQALPVLGLYRFPVLFRNLDPDQVGQLRTHLFALRQRCLNTCCTGDAGRHEPTFEIYATPDAKQKQTLYLIEAMEM